MVVTGPDEEGPEDLYFGEVPGSDEFLIRKEMNNLRKLYWARETGNAPMIAKYQAERERITLEVRVWIVGRHHVFGSRGAPS